MHGIAGIASAYAVSALLRLDVGILARQSLREPAARTPIPAEVPVEERRRDACVNSCVPGERDVAVVGVWQGVEHSSLAMPATLPPGSCGKGLTRPTRCTRTVDVPGVPSAAANP